MEKHKSEECCMMVRSSHKRKRKQHSKIYVSGLIPSEQMWGLSTNKERDE